MSKHSKLLSYLEKGHSVTAKEISGKFGLKNPARAVHYLREQGHCVYANEATLARTGEKTVKYRIGSPSKKMVSVAMRVLGASAFNG